MAWCITTVLSMHPCVSSCLLVELTSKFCKPFFLCLKMVLTHWPWEKRKDHQLWPVDCVLSMWGKVMIPMYRLKVMIPMYRLWLHGLHGLYGPRRLLSPERPLNLLTHSLTDPEKSNSLWKTLWFIPDYHIDNKSALNQVMEWCYQTTSHYPGHCWQRFMMSHVDIDLWGPQQAGPSYSRPVMSPVRHQVVTWINDDLL